MTLANRAVLIAVQGLLGQVLKGLFAACGYSEDRLILLDGPWDVASVIQHMRLTGESTITLIGVFTTDLRKKAADLLVRLRIMEESISALPFLFLSFDDGIDPIFNRHGSNILIVPCRVADLMGICGGLERLGEREKQEFIAEFGLSHLAQKLGEDIFALAHSLPKIVVDLGDIVKSGHSDVLELREALEYVYERLSARLSSIDETRKRIMSSPEGEYAELDELRKICADFAGWVFQLNRDEWNCSCNGIATRLAAIRNLAKALEEKCQNFRRQQHGR